MVHSDESVIVTDVTRLLLSLYTAAAVAAAAAAGASGCSSAVM